MEDVQTGGDPGVGNADGEPRVRSGKGGNRKGGGGGRGGGGEGGGKGKGKFRGGGGGKGGRNNDRNGGDEDGEGEQRERRDRDERNCYHGGDRGQGGGKRGRDNRGAGGKGGGNWGGGGHGGGSKVQPVPLGCPVASRVPNRAAAQNSAGAQATCLLCCESAPSYVSLGSCGHADVCWVCTLRLRALGGDRRCPVCKEDLDVVVITRSAARGFPSSIDLELMPGDDRLGVRFEDEDVRRDAMKLFEYRCRLDKCAYGFGSAFTTLAELEKHMWYVHWKQLCHTCLHGRPAFLCEQLAYDSRDMDRHCREGDQAAGGGNTVPPHPICKFCQKRFFDDEELTRHMHEKHHLCHICGRMGRQNEFYANFKCLAAHYSEKHHVCAHRECSHSGYRLTAFATEDELQLHMLKQHTDRSQMTDREIKELTRPLLQVGHRSYAEERAQNTSSSTSGKAGGKGRAAANESAFEVRFAWPGNVTADDCVLEGEDNDDEEKVQRYPMREVFDNDDDYNDNDNDDRRSAADDAGGDDAEEDDESDERLDPRVAALSLDVTVAASGRQQGMRCCLDALHAVIRALRQGTLDRAESSLPTLRAAAMRLSLNEIDNMERLRTDLDSSDHNDTCDWEHLERVLALRPLFFRLLRSGGLGARGTGIGPSIGPKTGAVEDQSEANWREWRIQAQSAFKALGPKEQQRLAAYTELCLRRRAELTSRGVSAPNEAADVNEFPSLAGDTGTGGGAAAGQRADTGINRDNALEFPTLGGGTGAGPSGPGSGWGRPKAQGPPPIVRSSKPVDAWETEDFPTLGGGSAPRAEASWSRPAEAPKKAQETPKPAQAPAPKSKAAPQAADFPSLGGSAPQSTAEPRSWAAQARERANAAPPQRAREPVEHTPASGPPARTDFKGTDQSAFPELTPGSNGSGAAASKSWAAAANRAAQPPPPEPKPEPPAKKDFKGIEEEHFPDLPQSAPKPMSSAAKAGAWARAKAGKAAPKPKATARERTPSPEPTQPADDWEELVVIHDPLDAVAKSEQANADRQAKKAAAKSKKGQGAKRLSLNAWASK